ncbi:MULTISPECIES: acyl-homoserine-lactone synthase [Pseudochelatococcus]|nr:acyl-homoserine-lactone synthase [Pseudochelatococcus contaminans]
MFIVIQKNEYNKYAHLIDQSFRLRKRIFVDQLRWKVEVTGPYERDSYDNLGPAYLIWCDEQADHLYGSVRLLPTTGPTLLYDVFRSTFPDISLIGPGIWEGTRMCVDETAILADFPDLDPRRAFSMLLLALCECALHYGIHTLISNYEPHMRRIYRRAGLKFDEIGHANGFGRFPVCCGVFEVSAATRHRMRQALKLSDSLYAPQPVIRSYNAGQSSLAMHDELT